MILETITPDQANNILGHHYLGGVEYHPTFCLTTQERDALAVFAPPIAQHFKVTLPGALELTRLWQSDWTARPLTQFLSLSLRWLRKLAPACPCIFSYADPTQTHPLIPEMRHTGGVYRAANFEFLGGARASDKWRTPDGVIWSPQKLYRCTPGFAERFPDARDSRGRKRRGTKSNAIIQDLHPDWIMIPGEPKLLFCFPMRLAVNDVRTIIGGRYAAP